MPPRPPGRRLSYKTIFGAKCSCPHSRSPYRSSGAVYIVYIFPNSMSTGSAAFLHLSFWNSRQKTAVLFYFVQRIWYNSESAPPNGISRCVRMFFQPAPRRCRARADHPYEAAVKQARYLCSGVVYHAPNAHRFTPRPRRPLHRRLRRPDPLSADDRQLRADQREKGRAAGRLRRADCRADAAVSAAGSASGAASFSC